MLNYEITGVGEENLVLLHGFMEDSTIWNEMLPFLSRRFQIITIDLPGFGNSQSIAEVQTVELMAQEVKILIDYLELDYFHLVGHSMGGYIGLAFAEYYPEYLRSLTLFFSSFLEDDAEKIVMREKSLRIIATNYRSYANAGIPNLFGPEARTHRIDLVNKAKEIAYQADVNAVLACTKGMRIRPNRKSVLEHFSKTILLLSGRYDKAVDYDALKKELPHRDTVKSYLLDCGHNGHWEKPSICAEIINTELLQ